MICRSCCSLRSRSPRIFPPPAGGIITSTSRTPRLQRNSFIQRHQFSLPSRRLFSYSSSFSFSSTSSSSSNSSWPEPPTSTISHGASQDSEPPSMTAAESAIASLLASLEPTEVLVRDVSGGCGSMYAIDITSPRFRGLSILKQQRMVNAALGDTIKGWHGVQIRTSIPPQ